MEKPLAGRAALAAGATRGAGRGIAVQLGAIEATAYFIGRTTRCKRSEMNRSETMKKTAALVGATGDRGIGMQVNHLVSNEGDALANRIEEGQGVLHVLVNDIVGTTKIERNKSPPATSRSRYSSRRRARRRGERWKRGGGNATHH